MQDLLRADFFPGHPGHQPVQQEDSRLRLEHGNCGAGRSDVQHFIQRLRWRMGLAQRPGCPAE